MVFEITYETEGVIGTVVTAGSDKTSVETDWKKFVEESGYPCKIISSKEIE